MSDLALLAADQQELAEILRSSPGNVAFAHIISLSRGRHPIEILSRLEALSKTGGSIADRAARVSRNARRIEAPTTLDQGPGLPLPHPLDAEWRFTPDWARALLDRAVAATNPRDPILLLGVPSVALAAIESNHDRAFTFIGEENVVATALNSLTRNDCRFRPAQQGGFAAAVLDPPWYDAPFVTMLSIAAEACKVGATIFVTAPSDGVRDGVIQERKRYFDAALAMGLKQSKFEAELVAYRTPLFEVAALRAAGIGAWLPFWRRADLVTLEKVVHAPPHLAEAAAQAKIPCFEFCSGGIRLRLLACRPQRGLPIGTFAKAQVFPSVSWRAKGRSAANLWTTCNRAVTVDPVLALCAMYKMSALGDLSIGDDSWRARLFDSEAQDEKINRLTEELSELIRLEVADSETLVGSRAWERTLSDARFLNGSLNEFLKAASCET